jgi:hypothetical protein
MSDTDPLPGAAPTPPADPAERNQWLEAELTRTRREAAGHRVKARELEEQLAKASSPEVLAAKDAQILDLRVGKTLAEGFLRHGVKNAGVMRAYLHEDGTLDRLRAAVDADDYGALVDDAITETLARNPELHATSTRRPVGGEFHGAGYQSNQITTKDQVDAMKPADVLAALERGDFDAVLGRRR